MPKSKENRSKGLESDSESDEGRRHVRPRLEKRSFLLKSPSKIADLLLEISDSESDSGTTADEMECDPDVAIESEISEDDAESHDIVRRSRAYRPRSQRRRASGGGSRGTLSPGQREAERDDAWSEDPTLPNLLPFTALPGLQCPVPQTPLQFFQLFFTRSLVHYITLQTNVYAEYRQKSDVFSLRDIVQFIGVRMFMGLVNLPSEHEYWENSPFGNSYVKQIMTRKLYKSISSSIHFFDRRNIPAENTDRLIHIRPIIEYAQRKCKDLYTPKVNLSLDEGTIPYKGRLAMKVYNPSKPDKYGIKIYYVCEAESGFVCDFSIYTGQSSPLRETVFGLLQRHLHLGYRVFMDNYYNSVSLAQELYDNGTHSCGTMRLPRGAPPALRSLAKKKLPRNELNFRRKGDVFVICWQDTKLVTIVSTMHNAATQEYVHKRRVKKQGKFTREDVKLDRPVAIGEYSKYMQGVDRFDQMVKYYHFDRRSIKWTKKAFFYFVDVMLVNSHILYQKYSTDAKKMPLKIYHKLICLALMHYCDDDWPHDNDMGCFPPPYGSPHATASDTPPLQACNAPGMPSTSGRSAETSDNEMEEVMPPRPRPKNFRVPDSQYRLLPKGEGGREHTPESIGKCRKRCRVCARNGKRQDTAYVCHACGGIPLCIKSNCFLLYHRDQVYWSQGARKK